ncbi:MAG: hypothetical protein B1H08_01360 [Candidatus Omnitrophica bacterium 4484_171]|nr:MAG: hypothetical protein B1H08_01360 [Candidatus Omnitrophica bacterium 4484_171]
MKVGIISDTHDNMAKIKDMVSILNSRGVDFMLHAGDFIAPFSLGPFKDLKCGWAGVFGNNDGERKGLLKKSEGRIKNPPYFMKLSSKTIILMHELKSLDADVLICGHTHQPEISRNGDKLIINPGEVCGWLTGKSSLAILGIESLRAEIIYF